MLMALAPSLNVLFNRPPAVEPEPSAMEVAAKKAAQATMKSVSERLSAIGDKDNNGAPEPPPSANLVLGAPTDGYTLEIDINDCPKKGSLTRKATQESITSACDVAILIRGRYQPPGDTSTDERRLHLNIHAKTQEDLDKAEAMVRELMGPMPDAASFSAPPPPLTGASGPVTAGTFTPGLPPPPSTLPGLPPPPSEPGAVAAPPAAPPLSAVAPASWSGAGPPPTSAPPMNTCLIEVGVPPEHAYAVRGKLLGPKGSYLKHIQDTTGVRVQLAGKGSGNHDKETGVEAPHGLSLSLNAGSPEALALGKALAENLVKAVM